MGWDRSCAGKQPGGLHVKRLSPQPGKRLHRVHGTTHASYNAEQSIHNSVCCAAWCVLRAACCVLRAVLLGHTCCCSPPETGPAHSPALQMQQSARLCATYRGWALLAAPLGVLGGLLPAWLLLWNAW